MKEKIFYSWVTDTIVRKHKDYISCLQDAQRYVIESGKPVYIMKASMKMERDSPPIKSTILED